MGAYEDRKVSSGIGTTVWVVLLVWFALALILGANGTFVREPGAQPLPILAGVLTPIIVFLMAFRFSGTFREFVMTLDLQLAAGVQAWRFAGLGFLFLYAFDILPGLFSWPAGLGDMAIGATAPWVLLALRDRSDFAAGRLFRVWNLLGMLDLVVAVSLGALSSVLGIGISGAVTTFPMAGFPLVIVPVFLVPVFFMLHLASLFQSRRLAQAGGTYRWACPPVHRGPTEIPA